MAEKTEKTVSQVQYNFGADAWKKSVDESQKRMGQLFDEVGKAHARYIELGNTQIDEMNELMKASFNSMNELASEWRKLVLDAAKRSTETFVR